MPRAEINIVWHEPLQLTYINGKRSGGLKDSFQLSINVLYTLSEEVADASF